MALYKPRDVCRQQQLKAFKVQITAHIRDRICKAIHSTIRAMSVAIVKAVVWRASSRSRGGGQMQQGDRDKCVPRHHRTHAYGGGGGGYVVRQVLRRVLGYSQLLSAEWFKTSASLVLLVVPLL
jgi:hypothetical protein